MNYLANFGVTTLADYSKRSQRQARVEMDERRRTYRYVVTRRLSANEAYEAFSAACYRHAAQASSSQPRRKATPPMGVMAPIQRIPVKLNT